MIMDEVTDCVLVQKNIDKLNGANRGDCVVVEITPKESRIPYDWSEDRFVLFNTRCEIRLRSMGFKTEKILSSLVDRKLQVTILF